MAIIPVQNILRILIVIFGLAILCLLLAIFIFAFFHFDADGIEPSIQDFGAFGSFVGGVGTMTVGLSTGMFLLYQLLRFDEASREQLILNQASRALESANYHGDIIRDAMSSVVAVCSTEHGLITLNLGQVIGKETYRTELSKTIESPTKKEKELFKKLVIDSIPSYIASATACKVLKDSGNLLEAKVRFMALNSDLVNISSVVNSWNINEFTQIDQVLEFYGKIEKCFKVEDKTYTF